MNKSSKVPLNTGFILPCQYDQIIIINWIIYVPANFCQHSFFISYLWHFYSSLSDTERIDKSFDYLLEEEKSKMLSQWQKLNSAWEYWIPTK